MSKLKDILSASSAITSIVGSILCGTDKNVTANPHTIDWEQEREDILERANWLCKKIITTPEALMNQAPSMIGREYQGEWAIYCCSMLTHALTNISYIYPEKKLNVRN